MTPLQNPESTNNHHSETESPSFVKRGKLWVPDTVQSRRSLLQKFWHWTGFKEKKLWDVLQLLIVPTALAIGAFYLQETAKQRDLQIADDRAKQEVLNRYFDQISTLVFEKKLRTAKERDEARILARARTLTALQELDGERKGQLIRFLWEADLIQGWEPVIYLKGANLSGANLSKVHLSDINLQATNLRGADFHGADLTNASLGWTDLQEAHLGWTYLGGAEFTQADLREADLRGIGFRGVSGHDSDLIDLGRANLRGADLRGVDLRYVRICNTTMPNGTKSDRDCDKLKQRK